MPQRAQWNGFLRLSLVSCPISLYPAIAADKRISFRGLNRITGNRLRTQLVDEGTGEIVRLPDRVRGYEVSERQFVPVEEDELQAAREEARARAFTSQPVPLSPQPISELARFQPDPPTSERVRPRASAEVESPPVRNRVPPPEPLVQPGPRPINNRTIELDRFVNEDEIDRRYLDTPYYIVPRDEVGEEAFAVVREAMRERHVAGVGRVMLQTRERPIIVSPMGNGLCGVTLRYAHEVREAAEFFSTIPEIDLPDDMVEMAGLLIDKKGGSFDPAYLEDRYRTVLVERLKKKAHDLPEKHQGKNTEVRNQNVIDLMAALKRSVAKEKIEKAPRTQSVGRRAKPASRRAAAASKSSPTKRSRSS